MAPAHTKTTSDPSRKSTGSSSGRHSSGNQGQHGKKHGQEQNSSAATKNPNTSCRTPSANSANATVVQAATQVTCNKPTAPEPPAFSVNNKQHQLSPSLEYHETSKGSKRLKTDHLLPNQSSSTDKNSHNKENDFEAMEEGELADKEEDATFTLVHVLHEVFV